MNKQLLLQFPARIRRLAAHPAAGRILRCAAALGMGLLLAGAGLEGLPVPLALALLCAQRFGPEAVCTYAGAAAGYLLLWDLSDALEPIAAGFLMLAGLALFRGLLPQDRRWFQPAAGAALYAAVGTIFLLQGPLQPFEIVFFAVRLVLLAAAAAAFAGPHRKTALLLAVIAGGVRVSLPGHLPLGAILAAAAVVPMLAEPGYLAAAVICGLTLDLFWQPSLSAALVFSASALAAHSLPLRSRPGRSLIFAGACALCVLLSGGLAPRLLLTTLTGSLLGMLLPADDTFRFFPSDSAPQVPESALNRAAAALDSLARVLTRPAAQETAPDPAALFDRAAAQVCRTCPGWQDCWSTHAAQTYRSLTAAAPALRRGTLAAEDFPDGFLSRCRQPDAFLAALNEALDAQRLAVQSAARTAQTRAIAAGQYRALSRLLAALPAQSAGSRPIFAAQTGVQTCARGGASVSGDRTASFTCGEWFYLLLCDGMGTGPEAARESAEAIALLRALIEAGFDAQDALQSLNSLYLLRGDGGFSTVDLAQLSLVTGEGYLHKWGAPPSYLLCGGQVQKIGTTSPPPGLGVGEKHRAECVRLSLQPGWMLVLVSDGVGESAALNVLRSGAGSSPEALAAGIVSRSRSGKGDDAGAAAVCLRPLISHRKHTTRRAQNLSNSGGTLYI